jgi:stage II sporulation protein D
MRPFFIGLACLGSILVLTGCATGLNAESGAPPITVSSAPDTVRVRILYTRSPARLACTGPWRFGLRIGGKTYVTSSPVRVRAMRSLMVFGHQSFKGEVIVVPASSSDTLTLNGRHYRGTFVIHPLGSGRYDVVEYLNMEEYLYGVLPKEVDPVWPADSLKAQAVVSRTYAVYSKSKASGERFDVSNSVLDQVYGGQDTEAQESNHAVDDTRGEILEDAAGKPVQAFFHSSCGGRTELPEYVWKSSDPADVFGVVDDGTFCRDDPHYKWQLTISYGSIRERLRRAGVRVREITSISIGQKTPSGRAETFVLKTSRGTVEIPGNKFRLALGPETLRSTLLTNLKAGKRTVWFEGRGWGHGVGLCQWGARGRALAGQNYKKILEAYYPKGKLVRI